MFSFLTEEEKMRSIPFGRVLLVILVLLVISYASSVGGPSPSTDGKFRLVEGTFVVKSAQTATNATIEKTILRIATETGATWMLVVTTEDGKIFRKWAPVQN
jgi:hypothetical protein